MFYQLMLSLQDEFGFLNVFRYQTFRAMLAFLLAFVIVLFLQPKFIQKLKALGIRGQPIRDDGPKDHNVKQGTPTMGGLVVILAMLLVTLLLADLSNRSVLLAIFAMLGYAAIGFVDDWRKNSSIAINTWAVARRKKSS